MAVLCPGCRREYDVTLFAFGRTLSCTCGRRVGIELQSEARDPSRGVPRFAADAMLGRLARWLRLLGFDCFYDAEIGDEALVRLAVSEARALLTRDRRLIEEWWITNVHLVRAERLDEQLAEVLRDFELAGRVHALSRCSECNERLAPATPEQVHARVPARVRRTQPAFAACPGCGRVYWEGSHAARIRATAERLAKASEASPPESDPYA